MISTEGQGISEWERGRFPGSIEMWLEVAECVNRVVLVNSKETNSQSQDSKVVRGLQDIYTVNKHR